MKEKISELADYSLLFNEKTGQLELKEWRCEGQKKLTISQMIEKNVKEKLKQKFNENPSLAQD